tara:strand:+ start:1197 stop:1598 length:402 start_codon:yes stop_codon:yes gene_type:complete
MIKQMEMKQMSEPMSRKQRLTALESVLDVVHDIAHHQAYRQVGEVIETQVSLTERVQENENKVCDLEDGVENTQRALLEIRSEILEDIEARMTARENTVEVDDRVAQLETQVATLEEKVAGLIDLLTSACNLE